MTLYEIDAAIKDAIDTGFAVDPETGEITDGAETLEALAADRDAKLENTALYIKNLVADAAAIKAEEATLAERRKAMENKAARLKEYLTYSMNTNGDKKFETSRCVLSFRKSEAAVIPDETQFVSVMKAAGNMAYLTIKEPTANKAAIKAALKAGKVIPGAQLEERQNLQIK